MYSINLSLKLVEPKLERVRERERAHERPDINCCPLLSVLQKCWKVGLFSCFEHCIWSCNCNSVLSQAHRLAENGSLEGGVFWSSQTFSFQHLTCHVSYLPLSSLPWPCQDIWAMVFTSLMWFSICSRPFHSCTPCLSRVGIYTKNNAIMS